MTNAFRAGLVLGATAAGALFPAAASAQDFRGRMGALGMGVPIRRKGLPNYMRRETARQGELAALTGIKMTTPK